VSDVLVVGDLLVDVVVAHAEALHPGSDTSARICLSGGGSAANTACWLAGLGERPRLLAARGDDQLGRMAAAELAAAGVRALGPVIADAPTGTCVVLVDASGERTMLADRGASDRLPASVVAPALDPVPGWLHVSGYSLLHDGPRPAGRAALAAGVASGATVSVDASSTAPIRAAGPDRFLRWIEGAHLLFANDDELAALGGLRSVLAHVRAAVVKHGAAGATWTDGTRSESVEGVAVDARDSTGAGDAFAAGWIAASRRGEGVAGALAHAVRVGATAVTVAGARPPSVDDAGAER
jgi:sugar/nucleoside kinase (ribokinase family)